MGLCAQCHKLPAVGVLFQEVPPETLRERDELVTQGNLPSEMDNLLKSVTPDGYQRMGAYCQRDLEFYKTQVPEGVKFRVEPIQDRPIENKG